MRYMYNNVLTGLSAGVDATLVDLLAGGEPIASLRDASASKAFGKLKRHAIKQTEDIYQVWGMKIEETDQGMGMLVVIFHEMNR